MLLLQSEKMEKVMEMSQERDAPEPLPEAEAGAASALWSDAERKRQQDASVDPAERLVPADGPLSELLPLFVTLPVGKPSLQEWWARCAHYYPLRWLEMAEAERLGWIMEECLQACLRAYPEFGSWLRERKFGHKAGEKWKHKHSGYGGHKLMKRGASAQADAELGDGEDAPAEEAGSDEEMGGGF